MTIDYKTKYSNFDQYIATHFSEEALAKRGAEAALKGAQVLAEELGQTVPVVTGGLKKSITVGKVQHARGEQFVKITFEGTRNGLPYKFIAAKVEMGHVKDGGITHANPFIYRARKNSELLVFDEMTQILGEGDD